MPPEVDDDFDQDLGDEAAAPQPVYPSVTEWVTRWLAHMVPRRLDGGQVAWCSCWAEHNEAVARLGALWAAWETTNLEGGTAPSMWWVHHFDAQWAQLTATNGPFAACGSGRHHPDPPPLPTDGDHP